MLQAGYESRLKVPNVFKESGYERVIKENLLATVIGSRLIGI